MELAAAEKRVEALEAEQQRGMVREEGIKADLKRMTEEYYALEQQKCKCYDELILAIRTMCWALLHLCMCVIVFVAWLVYGSQILYVS